MAAVTKVEYHVPMVAQGPNDRHVIRTLWPETRPEVEPILLLAQLEGLKIEALLEEPVQVILPLLIDEGLVKDSEVHEGDDSMLAGLDLGISKALVPNLDMHILIQVLAHFRQVNCVALRRDHWEADVKVVPQMGDGEGAGADDHLVHVQLIFEIEEQGSHVALPLSTLHQVVASHVAIELDAHIRLSEQDLVQSLAELGSVECGVLPDQSMLILLHNGYVRHLVMNHGPERL
mmetsp:Transcript_17611/g.29736  ORF Transcript_17611/g.29736 Transcript_17611/m.29736 type:complete len:233 (+) Transcript_17611:161-859(+)|eukprot:CAMPEP_0168620998 /NCGR_PEP_ID=MMETSP0449_2-20121227/7448_1 /TAXON_ID=1082188 /ORGANISM="Strombidium rassoulzadegani, Strain ras09" /LENGTH=232 /DNA_ID=CAMNT_0008662065 /DNA_START=87 /DNA_END=785 /DNA_ORIENTATION=-